MAAVANASTKRLFLAVLLPAKQSDHLELFLDQVSPRGQPPNWTGKHRWHITTVFMGKVPEPRIPALIENLDKMCVDRNTFELCVQGVGSFPHVTWMDLRKSAALEQLAKQCCQVVQKSEIGYDVRAKFVPHLSITKRKVSMDVKNALARYVGTPWQVKELTLVESIMEHKTSRYQVLRRFPLRA